LPALSFATGEVPEADNKVLPHQAKLYPACGTTHEEGHATFATAGFGVWAQDVLTFIRQAFARS